jgi:hypothetical protein
MTYVFGMTEAVGWREERSLMPTTYKTLRVLVVDDNRDGADALGLLLEELGEEHKVAALRPDAM